MYNTNPRRLRFSLRTVLLLIVLVAIVLTLWVSYRVARENRMLREENQRFRNEVGDLIVPVGSENKLHAVGAKVIEPWQWKWRVHVPAAGQYWVNAKTNSLPAAAEPRQPGTQLSLRPGENVIGFGLHRDERNRWAWNFTVAGGGMEIGGGVTAAPEIGTLVEAGCLKPSIAVTGNVTSDADLVLQLLRVRLMHSTGSVSSKEAHTAGPGAEVWISRD
jgi:hypothetical protein